MFAVRVTAATILATVVRGEQLSIDFSHVNAGIGEMRIREDESYPHGVFWTAGAVDTP
jgi:hypothetical protein